MDHANRQSIRTTFKVAVWLRALIATLCSPDGTSEHCPRLSKTKIDEEFIVWCKNHHRTVLQGIRKGDDPPEHFRVAERRLTEALESVRGQRVAALDAPLKKLIGDLVPFFLEFANTCRVPLEQRSGIPLEDWEVKLRRVPSTNLQEDGKTVNDLFNWLREEWPSYVRQDPARDTNHALAGGQSTEAHASDAETVTQVGDYIAAGRPTITRSAPTDDVAAAEQEETANHPPPPAVELREIDERPIVFGKEKCLLNRVPYKCIAALLRCYPSGLKLDELKSVSERAWVALHELRKDDPDWKKAIIFPGGRGKGGYRIAPHVPSTRAHTIA